MADLSRIFLIKNMEEFNPEKIVDKVRNDYNAIAKEWDISRSRPAMLKINLVQDVLPETEVLDLGCGNGLMVPFVLGKGAFYFGLDISENLVEICREKYRTEIEENKTKFVVGDATDLPFSDQEFDFVISFAVLHHIPSEALRRKYFSEIKRVLRTNGKVKITVWNLFNSWGSARFDIGNQLHGEKSGDVTIPWKGTLGQLINRYVHQFSVEELQSLAESSGFRNIQIGFYNRAGEQVENGEEIVLEMEY